MTLSLPRERFSKLSPNLQGALWLLLSCVGFSVMATFVKFAAREVNLKAAKAWARKPHHR